MALHIEHSPHIIAQVTPIFEISQHTYLNKHQTFSAKKLFIVVKNRGREVWTQQTLLAIGMPEIIKLRHEIVKAELKYLFRLLLFAPYV